MARRSDRPLDRMRRLGDGVLADLELLSLILGGARDEEKATLAAGQLLERFGGLRALHRADLAEIAAISGLGPSRAARLKAGLQLATRMAAEKGPRRRRFRSSRDIHDHVAPQLRDLPIEVFELLLLDARNGLVRQLRISSGTLTGSLVHPREVFRPAILEAAAAMVLIHNHPSGDPNPSTEDLAITERLRAAGQIVGIPVLDHLVVGGDGYVSFADTGRLGDPLRT